MRALVVMAALGAGCNGIYGLDETRALDAIAAPDIDGDGLPDGIDNCRELPNDGSDVDEDGVGDACDNCPLVANSAQTTLGDDDPIGDACDPRPADDNDCVILVDVFTRTEDFASAWDVTASADAMITPAPHALRLDPGVGDITLLARDIAPSARRYDVHILADIPLTDGGLWALSNVVSATEHSACGVVYDAINVGGIAAEATSQGAVPAFSSSGDVVPEPGGAIATIRLTQPRTLPDVMGCRVDYGYGLGLSATTLADDNVPGGGVPGLRLARDAATIFGIAIYEPRDGACPTPIVR